MVWTGFFFLRPEMGYQKPLHLCVCVCVSLSELVVDRVDLVGGMPVPSVVAPEEHECLR